MTQKYRVGDLVLCNIKMSLPINGECADEIVCGIITELVNNWRWQTCYKIIALKKQHSALAKRIVLHEYRIIELLSAAQQRKIT